MIRKSKPFDPAFIPTAQLPLDIDEVTYIRLYAPREHAAQTQKTVQPTTAPVTHSSSEGRPLVDVVNPQPKAFYAYLRMPKEDKPARTKKSSTRIKRTRSKKVK